MQGIIELADHDITVLNTTIVMERREIKRKGIFKIKRSNLIIRYLTLLKLGIVLEVLFPLQS